MLHLYALTGVLVVGLAVVVAYEVADWHRREQERELERWHTTRRVQRRGGGEASGSEEKYKDKDKGTGTAREGEMRCRKRKTRSHSAALLSDTDPFRLTDRELELDLPSPSPSHKEATLLAPNSPPLGAESNPHSRRSSTSTLDLLSPSPTSALSTPTLVSRPHSPSPSPSRSPPSAEEERLGGWHLINQKLGSSEEGEGRSRKALCEDDWKALEESVDWGKAPSSKVGPGGPQMVSL